MSKPQANRTSPSPQVWILRRRYIGPTRTKKMSGGKSVLKKDINHVSTLQNRAFELFPLCPFALVPFNLQALHRYPASMVFWSNKCLSGAHGGSNKERRSE
ncbi:hypothetical protein N7491_007726 [Penicillium cf. griseofulvum]|nr:hypothetical protein N7491_007726 [Penicillium cf. griseofulvum]